MEENQERIWETEHKGECNKIERTCILLKPDSFKVGMVGRILSVYESLGLKFLYFTTIHMTKQQIGEQYRKYIHQPFYPNLVRHLIKGPVVVGILEGHRVFYRVRKAHGYYNSDKGEPGELRTDVARGIYEGTLVHCSENKEAYLKEIQILLPGFNNDEL